MINIFRPRFNHKSVVMNDQLQVIGGQGLKENFNDVWATKDGKKWTSITENAPFTPRFRHQTVVFQNQIYLIGGNSINPQDHSLTVNSDVWKSKDGLNWEMITSEAEFGPRQGHTVVEFQGHMYLIAGSSGPTLNEYTLQKIEGELAHLKNDLWKTCDGITWDLDSANSIFEPRFGHASVEFQDKIQIIGGQDHNQRFGDISTYDGQTWSNLQHSASFGHRTGHSIMTKSDKIWLIGGVTGESLKENSYQNDIWISSDGYNWIKYSDGNKSNQNLIQLHTNERLNGEIQVIGGLDQRNRIRNYVFKTKNGYYWNCMSGQEELTARKAHSVEAFEGKIWVQGGRFSYNFKDLLNDIWSFTELSDSKMYGISQTNNIWSSRSHHTSVKLNNKIYLIGGQSINNLSHEILLNDVYVSDFASGNNFKEVTQHAEFKGRKGHTSVVHNDSIFVIGGQGDDGRLNDVWESKDGEIWTLVNDENEFGWRDSHCTVSFKGHIQVIGGQGTSKDKKGSLNDVQRSINGKHWKKVLTNIDFPKIQGHSCVVQMGGIFLIGGLINDNKLSSDVLFSNNGSDWKLIEQTNLMARKFHKSVVMDDWVYVIGGLTKKAYLNDIHRSKDGITWVDMRFSHQSSQ